jgi:hypothetical protein
MPFECTHTQAILALDRIAPSRLVKNVHQLLMRRLKARLELECPLGVNGSAFQVLKTSIDTTHLRQHLDVDLLELITAAPTPIPVDVLGIFNRDIAQQTARIEPLGRHIAGERLFQLICFKQFLGAAAKLLEGRHVHPRSFGKQQMIVVIVADYVWRRA